MDHTTMLTDVLKLHFGWNLARVKCLSCLIIALFKVKTKSIFSVVREDDSAFSHEPQSYDGKDALN